MIDIFYDKPVQVLFSDWHMPILFGEIEKQKE